MENDEYVPDIGRYVGAMDNAAKALPMRLERQNPTLRQQYQKQLDYHRSEIERLEELLKLLDDNPVIEKFMDLNRGRL